MTDQPDDIRRVESESGDNAEDTSSDDDLTLEEGLARLQGELEQERDSHLRALADLRNYRQRVAREQAEQTRFGLARLLESLLPTLDHLEMALAAAQEHGEGETALAEGVWLTYRQLLDTLGQYGLQPIAALGAVFDPAHHEAVDAEPVAAGDPAEGTVVEELRKGYLLHERLLRPAQVRVAVARD
ncbi:MAG TPA: nucleotide exchange factor GrpE [Armatimonadota bacterium]|jgi:molecular chaperone GrpE